jgi:hypothetical protein
VKNMEQREFLRKQMLKKTKEQINEKFAGREIHIIKAVNLLSDLDSINNLMKENASEWKIRQPTGEAEIAYSELEKNTQSIEEEKKRLTEFIEKEMKEEFPNFSVLATPILGAKLLSAAGSKKRLSFMPASTIQLLGAEKALFAHLRKNAKSPKHGHLFNHPLMQKLPRFKRGKAARIIAGKLAIALKQDYFNGENTSKEALTEMEDKINKIASAPVTPIEEQKEREYEAITQQRRKEQFAKDNKKKEYQAEHRSFTPEERKAFFEKNAGQKGFARRDPYRPMGQEGQRGYEEGFAPRKNFKKRRPMINKNYGRDEEGEENSYGQERRFGRRNEGNFNRNRGWQNDRERGPDQGRTKNKSFGKGRFNKPKHSFKKKW